jgi:hypothetical protein
MVCTAVNRGSKPVPVRFGLAASYLSRGEFTMPMEYERRMDDVLETKGWIVVDLGESHFLETNHRYGIECHGGTGQVAKVEGMGSFYLRRAQTMAAAPELLEALKGLLDGIERTPCRCDQAYTGRGLTDPGCTRCNLDVTTDEMDAARAAIAKATGKAVTE